jgi:putative PIN family toxin of toxin-antitoxin system
MAFQTGVVLSSIETLLELKAVIARVKFNRARTLAAREQFLSIYLDLFELALPTSPPVNIVDCRDPDDNKFLSLALTGEADLIVTGDADLLSLHPFRGIPILTPSAYLARHA